MGPWALAPVWLAVATAATYDVSARTETRTRSPTLSEQSLSPVLGDLELTPSALVQLRESGLGLQLSYAPRVVLRDLGLSAQHVELQHTGRAQGDWKPSRGLRLLAQQQLVYGQVDTTELAIASGGVPQPRPTDTPSVRYLSSETTAGVETTALVPRLSLSAAVTYFISGGLGDATVPLQQGPRATLTSLYRLDPRTGLTVSFLGSDSHFSTGSQASVLQLTGGLRYRFDRHTEGELSAGVGGTRNKATPTDVDPSPAAPLVLAPNGSAQLSSRLLSERGQTLDGRVMVRMTPFVDALTARAYQRLESTLALAWQPGARIRVNGEASGALVVSPGPQRGDAGLLLGATAQYSFNRRLWVEGAFRYSWTRQQLVGEAPFAQWTATLSLVVGRSGSF